MNQIKKKKVQKPVSVAASVPSSSISNLTFCKILVTCIELSEIILDKFVLGWNIFSIPNWNENNSNTNLYLLVSILCFPLKVNSCTIIHTCRSVGTKLRLFSILNFGRWIVISCFFKFAKIAETGTVIKSSDNIRRYGSFSLDLGINVNIDVLPSWEIYQCTCVIIIKYVTFISLIAFEIFALPSMEFLKHVLQWRVYKHIDK